MKRTLCAVALFALIAALGAPSNLGADDGTRDVIIQAQGSTDALVSHIRSIGGSVKFQYRNVPAVAASVPAGELANVGAFPGVTKVERDRLFYLADPTAGDLDKALPVSFAVEDMAGVKIEAIESGSVAAQAAPEGYANFLYTGALGVWADTNYGAGSIVAIVDTGTAPNVCLSHAVVGAPGYPDGYNATGDGVPATSTTNHYHGTFVGGVVASSCSLDFSADPTNNIYLAQAPYLGWPADFVPIFGQAPESQLYPVKVFPESGAGSPTSVILDGLDHILTQKTSGALDIDVVNMSLGGPTGWDGRDAYDRFIGELQRAGMLVVTSAGNDGPIPNSVGSPATSFSALSVAAVDYAPSSRTLYEWLGLTYMGGTPGQGMVMRPTDETRIVNYSARGPLSDGRFGPEMAALGHWNFHAGPQNELRWAGGTSFASPTVAGAAALLNAWWEAQGRPTNPKILEKALLYGADPDVVGPTWQGMNDQGYGVLDVPASLDKLMHGKMYCKKRHCRDQRCKSHGQWAHQRHRKSGKLRPNVLGRPVRGQVQTWESEEITLAASEPFNAVFAIGLFTSKVTIEVFDVVTPDNSAYAYWANALEVHLQSAKRTAFGHPVEVYWYPHSYGSAFDIVVEDGPWTFWDIPWVDQPMEPGLMKLGFIPDYSNEAPVSFKVRITRENEGTRPDGDRVDRGWIRMDDSFYVPVEIPDGVTTATFDLLWYRNWSRFQTNDLDMIIFGPDFAPASLDGATSNAPERAIISDPAPGTWWVLVDGYEVHRPDLYKLYVKLE